MPSHIPQARELLLALAAELPADHKVARGIRVIVRTMLRRDRPMRRVYGATVPATPELCDQIRLFAEANPNLSQQEIAEFFNVNTGRVSEALRGLR